MKVSRRHFVIGSGLIGGGLILGFYLKPDAPIPFTRNGSFQPNAWLQITNTGQVIFQLDKAEMGQGVTTSLPMILAEELDYNPQKITVEMAGIHPLFKNPGMGVQLTGGSTSVANSWLPLREAGAVARNMLMVAAAKKWQVDIDSCSTDDGKVLHNKTGRSFLYANLVDIAKTVDHVKTIQLKDAKYFKWIGKSLPRMDMPEKINGTAIFGSDVYLPNMKIAIVKRCPHFGGKIHSFDDSEAKKMDGVCAIFAIHSGVAIVADSYWQAQQSANILEIEWDKGPLTGLNSVDIREAQEKALKETKAHYQIDEGDIDSNFLNGATQLKANYAAPYFHHSPMEPQNTTAIVKGNKCEVWCPSQGPDLAQAVIAHFTGLKRNDITVHTTLLGGGFGRRGYVDFAGEAGAIAAAYPEVPVKLMWTREDDMQHDYYRPATYHGIQASLNTHGELNSWQHHIVSTSIIQGCGVDLFSTLLPSWIPSEIARSISRYGSDIIAEYDPTMTEGAHIPYAIKNIQVGSILYDPGIPTGFWRSVGHSHNAFVVESFMDECAYAAGKSPVEFRRQHLLNKPRHLRVMQEVIKLSELSTTNKHQGLAVHESFGSYVAQVVEVSVGNDTYTVDKVFCAVDCGLPINPDIIIAQMQSGIIYALTAAIKSPVTFADGATIQSNFHDLPVLRMNEIPEIKVVIIDSHEDPSGVGEIAVPPLAPALANALFVATGQRLREMPFRLSLS